MPDDMGASMDQYVRTISRRRTALIERACEQALAGGEHGVLVTTQRLRQIISQDRLAVVDETTAAPDPSVPYGRIIYREDPDDTPPGAVA
ncbi:hypothetical protein FDO65_10045 [Nakamurella flava]|uniref:Uncharacterized protein n=1 Tax=Nakamurella flava TaxID=2576308 RepID=A0A4U6QNS9_9ACTN|nr:hypothetical protein [Nakamurella flava]TKV61858.1 hypothetical protein FDO65_10045 [Nakamurella flava]